MRTILNLTQHKATPAQIEDGVIDVTKVHMDVLKGALTFDTMPDYDDYSIKERCDVLVFLVNNYRGVETVMIGGAPWLMSPLVFAMHKAGVSVVYAYSERVSEESMDPDTGIVHKTNVFKHVGLIEDWGNATPEWVEPPYGAYVGENA